MKVVLISLYELGRAPLGLANAAPRLRDAGFDLTLIDLSLDRFQPESVLGADLIALSLPMYTATRLAVRLAPEIRAAAPTARLAAFGLYAPLNEALLRELGFDWVLGGESDEELANLAVRLRDAGQAHQDRAFVSFERLAPRAPDRAGLAPLSRYAKLRVDGEERLAAYVEASRGCKHVCRHCPVVPIYEGHFNVMPVPQVLADIRAEVARGARHISFADPDFFNGPGHAERVVRALHAEFPEITFDATIKIEHLLREARRLPVLRASGCLFITSAVESLDDSVLARLLKGHTRADFEQALALVRAQHIALLPTFIPFHPWTTRASYLDLLQTLVTLDLVEAVSPVQLAIRLLVPRGSRMLDDPESAARLGAFREDVLGYPWTHEDPAVDALQRAVQAIAGGSEDRHEQFRKIWALAHQAAAVRPPAWQPSGALAPAQLSEPWYCCAEPVPEERARS